MAFTTQPGFAAQATQESAAKSSDTVELEEVLVTARKRKERLQDTPQSVTAITGEQLEKMGAKTVEDYFRMVPGLNIIDLGADGKKYVIRGLNFEVEPHGDALVRQYLDDYALPQPQPDIKLYDLERVEVLRGPQGTLFGSGSMGGTIRNLTNRPNLNKTEGSVSLAAGSVEDGSASYNGQVVMNLPLIADKLGLRVVGYHDTDGGFVDNVYLGAKDVNTVKNKGGRATLLFRPSDKLSLRGMFLFHQLHADDRNRVLPDAAPAPALPAILPPPPPPDDGGFGGGGGFVFPGIPAWPARPGTEGTLESRASVREPIDDKITLSTFTVDYDFGFATLTSATAYETRNKLDTLEPRARFFPFGTYNKQHVYSRDRANETRLVSNGDTRLQWTTGAYYSDNHSDVDGLQFRPGLPPGLFGALPPPHEATGITKAVFAETTFKFTPALAGTLGGRYASDYHNAGEESDPNARLTDKKPTFKAGLSYKMNENLMFYGLLAQGFRGGASNNVTTQSLLFEGLTPEQAAAIPRDYKSDIALNHEVGLKTSLADGRIVIDTAAYYTTWKDLQTTVTDPAGFFFATNAGKAHTAGVELETQWKLTRALNFSASLAVQEAKVDEPFEEPGTSSAPPVPKGSDLPGTPKYSGSVGMDYNFTLQTIPAFLHADAAFAGKTNTTLRGTSDPLNRVIRSYVLTNARAGIELKGLQLALYCQNVTNRRVYMAVLPSNAPGVDDEFSVNRPRNYGISLRKDFSF